MAKYTEEQIAAAQMAAFVGSNLKAIDDCTISSGTNGRAAKIHPSQFLNIPVNRNAPQAVNNVNVNAFVDVPKATHIESIDAGMSGPIDMIPIDPEMQELIKKQEAQRLGVTHPPQPQVAAPVQAPQPAQQAAAPVQTNESLDGIRELLSSINNKLDYIMKNSKISKKKHVNRY